MFSSNAIRVTAFAAASLLAASASAQTGKPAEIKIGITTFLSGPASVFGVPAKAAADLYIEQINAAGGIKGVKIVPTYIDEGVGGDKFLSEYRRVVQEQGVKIMLASISSGNCNTIAPVAEDLKVLNVMWDCGTEKVLEEKRYRYVVRTQANATTEMVAIGAVPAAHQAQLQDHRRRQPGLRLRARLVGAVPQHPDDAQARHQDRCRAVPEIRRDRLFDRGQPAAGAAAGRHPVHLVGRRPRHLHAPGGAARSDQERTVRAAAGGKFARADRHRHCRTASSSAPAATTTSCIRN